ncbi:MAG: XrtA/PEP-CTERM system TPR-repeat protein PrsT [Sulfuriferula sp.]
MPLKPLHSALILALLTTATLQGCDHNANLTEQQLIQRAKDYEDKGDLKAGVIELKNALQKNPNSPQARLLLGEIYLKANMGAAAESELDKAQKLGITQETIKPLLGEALLLMGKYDQVLAEIQPSDTTSKQNLARIYQMRGEALLKTGKLQEACNLFQQSLDTHTGNPPTYWGLAQCAVADHNMTKAREWLNAALKIKDQQAQTWIFIGDWEQLNKNTQGAVAAYTNALKIEPENLVALQNRAIINLSHGQLDPARSDIEKIRKIAPKSLLSKYTQALLSFKQQKYPEARDALQEALQIAPDHTPTLLLSGAVNYAQGSYEQAANQLEKVLEKAPGSAYARKLLAATQAKLGQDKQALATLQPLDPEQSNDPQLLALAGDIYLRTKEYTKANQLLEKAALIVPKNAAIRTGLGVSLLASGETERALADLESAAALDTGTDARTADTLLILTLLREKQYDRALQAIADLDKKQPNNPLTYNFQGGAYFGKNDLANARKSFEQALAIKPDFFPAAANLAQLDLQAKNPEAARKRFEGILNIDKNNLQAMMALAQLAAMNKNDQEALGWLEKANKTHPEALQPRELLARHYLAINEHQKALSIAKGGLEANRDSPEAMNLLATSQLAAGEKENALASFQKLVELVPQSPSALIRLANAQLALKQTGNARASVDRALQLKPDFLDAQVALIGLDIQAGRYSQAILTARKVQRQLPRSAVGWGLEGDALMMQKQPAMALLKYETAWHLQNTGPLAVKIHNAQILVGKSVEADTGLFAWLKTHPEDASSRLYLAQSLMGRGNFKLANQNYAILAQKFPNNMLILNNYASSLQAAGDPRALDYAERANKLAPDNPVVMDTLAVILTSQGKPQRALQLLKQAQSKDPKNAQINFHYAQALAKSGDTIQARMELERLLSSGSAFPEQTEARTLLKQLKNTRE